LRLRHKPHDPAGQSGESCDTQKSAHTRNPLLHQLERRVRGVQLRFTALAEEDLQCIEECRLR
jgi:hypothetical protein